LLGGAGWTPATADYDGDGSADPTVYQATNGTWKVKLSSDSYRERILSDFLGGPGYSVVSADYDGDGLADPAIYKQADGTWEILSSQNDWAPVVLSGLLGGTGWEAVPGDYDGDGLADFAVRNANGTGEWRVMLSLDDYRLQTVQIGL
jgi:hypothetical protein